MTKPVLKETQCDCEICSKMCKGPCCGTVEETAKLIKLGYADRLMMDDDPWDVNPEPSIRPALKGYEGRRAPTHVRSEEGCTFWKNGLCELHDKGLKPFSGRYAHHDSTDEEWHSVSQVIVKSWQTKKAANLVKKFNKMQKIGERDDN
jgi:hypothetical protein